MCFIATAETAVPAAGGDVVVSIQDDSKILAARLPRNAPAWIRTLARASDQFTSCAAGRRAPRRPASLPAIRGFQIGDATP